MKLVLFTTLLNQNNSLLLGALMTPTGQPILSPGGNRIYTPSRKPPAPAPVVLLSTDMDTLTTDNATLTTDQTQG